MKNLNKILVNQDLSIKEAMRIIYNGAIKMAIVVDNRQRLVGVVTDGDIRRGILNGKSINEKVIQVTNQSPIYLHPKSPEEEIISVFKNPDIIGIPLIDKNKIIKDFVMQSRDSGLIYFSKHIPPKKHLEKILVIGGGGYIGSMLVRELLRKGYKVNVLDCFIYGKESLDTIKDHPNLKIIEGDTRHIEIVTDASNGVDAVVHMAELVGDPICDIKPKVTQDINYLATKLIASVCKHYQINRFVYMSSCSVYGASANEEILTEESPLNPQSLYARMKIESETALLEMADGNFSPTILRLGTVFGHSYRPRFDLVVNLLTAKAVKEGKITIFGGDQWRPNVHVLDVVQAIIRVLEAPLNKVSEEIFNVGSNQLNFTINQLGEKIKQLVPTAEILKKQVDGDKRNYKVDFTKIADNLDFEATMQLEDGINEIIQAFQKNKIKGDFYDEIYSNVQYLKNRIN